MDELPAHRRLAELDGCPTHQLTNDVEALRRLTATMSAASVLALAADLCSEEAETCLLRGDGWHVPPSRWIVVSGCSARDSGTLPERVPRELQGG
jgi:hypothetical protein